MGPRIGIVAGSGQFPVQAIDTLKSQGYACVVAGIRGEAVPELKLNADAFEWIGVTELVKLISFFKSQNIREVVLVGKIEPRVLFQEENCDEALVRLLAQVKDKTPTSVLKSLIDVLASEGLDVKDPGFLMEPFLCPEGVLTQTLPSPKILEDVEFAWSAAKAVADLDIGQTVVVKDKAIIAVEGMEGTDETVKRAGRLAGKGIVALKVGRSRQDIRVDLPAVGLETMRSLAQARAAALVFEARKVLFFQKEETLALADANQIAVMAKKARVTTSS